MIFRFLVLAVAVSVCMAVGPDVFGADPPAKPEAHAAAEGHDAHGKEEHGHGAHIGAEGVSRDPSEFRTDLAVWTFFVFLLLMLVLRKFAWGPIMAGLEHREKVIAEHIAVAEQSEEAARHLLAQYEQKLAAAQDEVRAIMDEARKHAERTHQEILAKAREEAQAEMTRATSEISLAKDQALISLAEAAAHHAVDLAGKILDVKLTPADHSALIEKALAGFPEGQTKLR
jgi:F-type H+-transporting ATPase subunit b